MSAHLGFETAPEEAEEATLDNPGISFFCFGAHFGGPRLKIFPKLMSASYCSSSIYSSSLLDFFASFHQHGFVYVVKKTEREVSVCLKI